MNLELIIQKIKKIATNKSINQIHQIKIKRIKKAIKFQKKKIQKANLIQMIRKKILIIKRAFLNCKNLVQKKYMMNKKKLKNLKLRKKVKTQVEIARI